MSTPNDPGRPEDRPSDQPGYPPAPPPAQYPQGQPPQGGGYAGGPAGDQFPPAPDYGQQQQPYGGQPPYAGGQQPGGQPPYAGGQPPYGSAPAYGSAPSYGDPYGQPATPANPPNEVLRAVQLMFARVVLGILSALVAFASADSIKDSIRENDPTLTQSEVDSAFALAIGITIFFGLVFAVLYILLAIQVRKGKNWARIVTFVLAGLGVLGGVLSLVGDGTGLEKGISLIVLLVDVGIIVLLAMKPSSQYFAARKAPRY